MTELALAVAHHLAHVVVTGDDGDHAVDARLADRRGDVGAGDEDAPFLVEADRVAASLRATVLLPAPAGPSIATITAFSPSGRKR